MYDQSHDVEGIFEAAGSSTVGDVIILAHTWIVEEAVYRVDVLL